MNASPRLLVLLFVALHLQCLYTKYYLVETDSKASRVHRNHKENIKHQSSSKTSKVKPGSARHKDKKTGRVRRKHIGVDYVENQPNPTTTTTTTTRQGLDPETEAFLADIGLDNTDIKEKFVKEHITLDLLKTMNFDHLGKIGITSFGHKHRIITEIKKLKQGKNHFYLFL